MVTRSDTEEEPMATANRLKLEAELIPSRVLLEELRRRGGHPGALAEAALLCIKKSADYNQGSGHEDIHAVDRSPYFPFGAASYAQMLHTKSTRFVSLVKKGGPAEFEGLRDTALDIINYAGFYIASLEKKE